jgi:hypothetical protein
MQTTAQPSVKKISDKGKPFILKRRYESVKDLSTKKLLKRKGFERFSPFLLLAIFLPMLFLYSLIAEKINGGNFWFQFSLLVFLEINILFIDFALWNYYGYKKFIGIWLAESLTTFIILYLII